jgi:hypothetical protein
VNFFLAKIRHFAIKKKVRSNLWSRELSGKFPQKSPDFKEESYENIKILEDSWRFLIFVF